MYKTFRISIYVLKSVFMACMYLFASYSLVYKDLAGGNLLAASIYNIVFIFVLLTMDKVETYLWKKVRKKKNTIPEKPSTFKKIKGVLFLDVPFKTGLYFFYIFLLVCSAIVTAEPDFPVISNFSNYLKSVYYGLLVLMATDKFLELVLKQLPKEND